MEGLAKFVGTIIVAFVFIFGAAILFTLPTMWLVNYVFTPATLISLFGVAQLSFWKAMGLSTLCAILFKGSSSSSD